MNATFNPGKPPVIKTETLVIEEGTAPTVTITMSLRDAVFIRTLLGSTNCVEGFDAFRGLKRALDPKFPLGALLPRGYHTEVEQGLLDRTKKAVDDYLASHNLKD